MVAVVHVTTNGRPQSMTVRWEIPKPLFSWKRNPGVRSHYEENESTKWCWQDFVDSCPDLDNTPIFTGRAESPARLFKGHEISDISKPLSPVQFALQSSQAEAVSSYSQPFSLHIPWEFQVPPFSCDKSRDLSHQAAPCSHFHTKHSGAATPRGRELKRPFDCFFYLCMRGKTTSLALGDLQIETFSWSEVQMSEMMQESSNLALLPLAHLTVPTISQTFVHN